MKKENTYMGRSLLDLAYDYVSQSKEQVSFKDLWAYVVEKAGLDEETAAKRVSSFYTNLMLDGRFVTLGENQWDLRSRHTFDKVHIDMKDVYSDVETDDDDDEEEDEEDKEYNKVFNSKEGEDFEEEEEESEKSENEEEEEVQ